MPNTNITHRTPGASERSTSPASFSTPAGVGGQIVARDVGIIRRGHRVLERLDLAVSPTSRIGIVGENGRGKSTLLQLLAGTLKPDEGSIERVGTIGVAEQELASSGGRSVGDAVDDAIAEAVETLRELDAAAEAMAATPPVPDAEARFAATLDRAESLDAWDAERRVRIALEALDAAHEPDRLLIELSVGQRYRVRLACLLGAADDILLLDEPTNHLDRAGLEFLTDRLRERRGGVVLVSHDHALLHDVADTIVDLDPAADGRPRIWGDGYDGYRAGRQAAFEHWQQLFDREQAERERLEVDLGAAQARLVGSWRPPKGTGKHARATRASGVVQAVHRRQADLEAHAVTTPEPPVRLSFPDLPVRSGTPLVTTSGVTMDARLTSPVSVTLTGGSRLVVTGPNGAGKSTLLSLLAGEVEPSSGIVSSTGAARVGFLRQESDLASGRTARDVYDAHLNRLEARGVITPEQSVSLASLGLLRRDEADRRIGELSSGQQRRLDLALVLAARPNLLLLDEPTNHLSIALVDELTEALAASPAAVVVSSHDRQFLRDVTGWPVLQLGE